jgi:hypothetical protein
MSSQELTLEERKKRNEDEIIRMFNLSEQCTANYIHLATSFGDAKDLIPKEELFNDVTVLTQGSVPLIIHPITEYGPKYLKFSIDIVESDYKCQIPEALLENKQIEYIVGFIFHSVFSCYNAILQKFISDDKINTIVGQSLHLEVDDETLSLAPVYIYPQRRQEIMLNHSKKEYEKKLKEYDDILNNKSDVKISSDVRAELAKINEDYQKLNQVLNSISYDIDEANSMEQMINSYLKTVKKIGIIFEELDHL